jgi:ATP-dependent DNA ligase
MASPNGMCATKSSHLGRGHLDGARKTGLPQTVKPALAKLVEAAPEGDHWLHEIKFDGYRMLARIDRKRVRLISRHGVDWTERFAAIAADLVQLNVENAFIDGGLWRWTSEAPVASAPCSRRFPKARLAA